MGSKSDLLNSVAICIHMSERRSTQKRVALCSQDPVEFVGNIHGAGRGEMLERGV